MPHHLSDNHYCSQHALARCTEPCQGSTHALHTAGGKPATARIANPRHHCRPLELIRQVPVLGQWQVLQWCHYSHSCVVDQQLQSCVTYSSSNQIAGCSDGLLSAAKQCRCAVDQPTANTGVLWISQYSGAVAQLRFCCTAAAAVWCCLPSTCAGSPQYKIQIPESLFSGFMGRYHRAKGDTIKEKHHSAGLQLY